MPRYRIHRIYTILVFCFAVLLNHLAATVSYSEPIKQPMAAAAPPAAAILEQVTANHQQVLLPVSFLSQLPDYPTGCESVSAVMALRYLGFDISVETFISQYLLMADAPYLNDRTHSYTSADPNQFFFGDPRSESGWGCFPPVIQQAVEAFAGDELQVQSLYGCALEQLYSRYIDNGIPVLLWATSDMQLPDHDTAITIADTGESYTWRSPRHCLLLIGYTDTAYLFHDPLQGGAIAYEKNQVLAAYRAMGEMALVIRA